MGVRGAKSWEGGGGFKVIIHHIGKRWGQFSSWGGGGGFHPSRQNQASSKILLHFSFHAILYYIYYIYIYYIYYNIILYILYYIYYIILYYIIYIIYSILLYYIALSFGRKKS